MELIGVDELITSTFEFLCTEILEMEKTLEEIIKLRTLHP